jgi:hypothetical protein
MPIASGKQIDSGIDNGRRMRSVSEGGSGTVLCSGTAKSPLQLQVEAASRPQFQEQGQGHGHGQESSQQSLAQWRDQEDRRITSQSGGQPQPSAYPQLPPGASVYI